VQEHQRFSLAPAPLPAHCFRANRATSTTARLQASSVPRGSCKDVCCRTQPVPAPRMEGEGLRESFKRPVGASGFNVGSVRLGRWTCSVLGFGRRLAGPFRGA